MSLKGYDWENGAPLLAHTSRKLKVLREYFAEYLRVRCGRIPQQGQFRLAIVDGFCGGGRYAGGEMGSPLVFLDTLASTIAEIDVTRAVNGFRPLSYECMLVANDLDAKAVGSLRSHAEPVVAQIRETLPHLRLEVHYHSERFQDLYPSLRSRLQAASFPNVIFNLDQCGDRKVARHIVIDIMNNFNSGEVYNDVLHANANAQAHFGRAGLDMFSFDPSREGELYLFAAEDRERSKAQLLDDVPRTIAGFGDAITVAEFYNQVYSRTPAHSDDIRAAIFESPDVEVLTEAGGTRRRARSIRDHDILRVSRQRSFFFMKW